MNISARDLEFLKHGGDLDGGLGVYKTLLESTRAIPWKIDWETKAFAYIGPQIEKLLGWEQDSWKTVEDWAARMHPDDRDFVVNFCVSQSMEGKDHEADYRAMTKDGDYVWIRDVVHVVRHDDGEVDCLIGFMFDITERKRDEEKLLEMQKQLEALSFEDGLTGAANRRLFDERIEAEFENARRSGEALTLMLIDIDHFKQFNDLYGHLQGDDCLVRVAGVLKQLGRRRRDVVARYGGEEFAILLPGTEAESARAIAERCREDIVDLKVPHETSSCADFVSASVGVGTVVPSPTMECRSFVQSVDKLLYAAKKNGRNRVCSAVL